jgi:lipopolysaccharide heptosyltransferase II
MPALTKEKKDIQNVLQKNFEDKSQRDIVALVPGAGWVTKEWPVEYFIDLANSLIAKDKVIVLIGGPAEIDKGQEIELALPKNKVLNLIGKTNLKELAALMDKVGLCIGGDTGPVHIAAAMGTRIIALFGASSGHRAGPYGKNVTIISTSEKCAPCFKRKCPLNKNCMEKISVAEVIQHI